MTSATQAKQNQNPVINASDPNAGKAVSIEKHRTLLRHLFPSKLQRAINESDLMQSKTELEYREKALKMLKESQLQAIQEKYNQFLQTGKTIIRKDSGIFFAEQLNIFEKAIDKICEVSYQRIEEQYDNLNNIRVPFLKTLAEKRLEENSVQFHETIEKLMFSFRHILDEGV